MVGIEHPQYAHIKRWYPTLSHWLLRIFIGQVHNEYIIRSAETQKFNAGAFRICGMPNVQTNSMLLWDAQREFEELKFSDCLTHKYDILRLCYACIILNNLWLDILNGDQNIEFIMESFSGQGEICGNRNQWGKTTEHALMYYLNSV